MQPKRVPKSPITCCAAELVASRFRQIHLDFHTSELIPDVGARFKADAFAERLADARVNWVTLFAKCHHGLSYYPTRAGTMHPALGFDLLGEQVAACRKRGIVTPAYISVRVDEHNAHVHPEWIGRLKGASSHHVNHEICNRKVLEWQDGYGVVSFGTKDLPWVLEYIRNQRQHHASKRVFDRLERIDRPEEARPQGRPQA
jgi:hypothetical protein